MVARIPEETVEIKAVLVYAQGRLQVQVVPPQVQRPNGEEDQGFRYSYQYQRHKDSEVLQRVHGQEAVRERARLEED